jgi:mannose-6-phosphate isomerase-like protein (cupin superfamily)
MAWQYATYINEVAAAGKSEYPIPLFVNAALIRPNYLPGQYNSGGPLPQSMDLWRAGAPKIDLLCPDIYFNEFEHWARAYTRPDNPLFVPESQGGSAGAANALYAFGALSAIGFSPFGVDQEGNVPLDLVGITNPAERPDNSAIARLYLELSSLTPMILKKQQSGDIAAGVVEGEAQRSARINIGEYTANLTRAGSSATPGSRVSAMFIQTGRDEFLVIGSGDGAITFTAETPGAPQVGIESIDEQIFENGKWVLRRRINGDEDSHGQVLRLYAADLTVGRIYKVRLYRYR